MFTGIVEHRGSVLSVETADGGMRLVLDTGPLPRIELGGSIAVNGVCLTGVETGGGAVAVDVVTETISRSTLGELRPGDPVNLERPMRADGRFDGHRAGDMSMAWESSLLWSPRGQGKRIRLRVPAALSRYVIEKGSITVDGVSLTVAAVEGDEVEIALIPPRYR